MPNRIIEISTDATYLKTYRGFLTVMCGDEELGRVDYDEIASVIISAQQTTLSKQVMVRLASENIPLILCGTNYHPISITLPYGHNHRTTVIQKAQVNSSKPLNKRLWQQLVKTKIKHQQLVLQQYSNQPAPIKQLQHLQTQVRSGDDSNIEAQAARVYWQALFGDDFRRRQKGSDFLNSALNYGYAVLRAACARALVGAGLNPVFGIHHRHALNPFCLADDILEIYRPLADAIVKERANQQVKSASDTQELDVSSKQQFAAMLNLDFLLDGKTINLNHSMQALAVSLVTSYENKKIALKMPKISFDGSMLQHLQT